MRYYLDTNILVFLNLEREDELDVSVRALLFDYSNTLLTSTTAVQELIHLSQISKLCTGRRQTAATDILQWLDDMSIRIMPVNASHLKAFANLPLHDDHRDPNDRLIIAQAISDRIPLISSDRKFSAYAKYGLDFVYNER